MVPVLCCQDAGRGVRGCVLSQGCPLLHVHVAPHVPPQPGEWRCRWVCSVSRPSATACTCGSPCTSSTRWVEVSVGVFCLKAVRYCMYMWRPMYLLNQVSGGVSGCVLSQGCPLLHVHVAPHVSPQPGEWRCQWVCSVSRPSATACTCGSPCISSTRWVEVSLQFTFFNGAL